MLSAPSDLAAAVADAALLAVAFAIVFLTACRAVLHVSRRLRYRSIFADAIMQAPGHRLRRRLDVQRDQARVFTAALLALPLAFLAVLLAWPGELAVTPTQLRWPLTLTIAAAAVIWLFVTLARNALAKARTRYALAADMAVSHALERVMKRDFSVFHDVHIGSGVVDKVVVGHKGIFALTLCVRQRRRRAQTQPSAAQFDGRRLAFPDGDVDNAAALAQRHAHALATHLGGQFGRPIAVCPVLVVPGWSLTCTVQPDFPVVNERNIDLIAQWNRPETWLLHEEAEQVQTYLNASCRDSRYAN